MQRHRVPAEHAAGRTGPAPAARPTAPHRSGPGAAALLALQSTAGNAAVTRALQRRPVDPGPDDALSVQRKVGLEIETGWYVDRLRTLRGKRKLEKYDLVGERFDGFAVTADETPDNRSDVEFVVDPPVEEGPQGEHRLDVVMQQLVTLANGMARAGAAKKPFTQDRASGRRPDRKFLITPHKSDGLKGSPQITMGLRLGAIPQMAPSDDPQGQPPADHRPAPASMVNGTSYVGAQAARVTGRGALPNPSDDLRGLVTVISIYLIKGQTNLPLAYPKQIANMLLARTDFARLFTLLPAAEQTILKSDPDLWVGLVVDAASDGKLGGGTIDPDGKVIALGTKESGERNLKTRDWLTGILENDDKLNRVFAPTSMGAFGDRVEDVGPDHDRRAAGIFEARLAQVEALPVDRWRGFAREAHRYVTRLNGG